MICHESRECFFRMTNKNHHDAQSIKVYKGLYVVWKRPGMYIGNVNDESGLHQMLHEVIDNSIDEEFAGHAKTVWVILHSECSTSVKDDSRRIPVDMHEIENMSAAELIMTLTAHGIKVLLWLTAVRLRLLSIT